MGLGKSGLAAARFLVERGALVRATDGSDKKEVLENARLLQRLGARVQTGGHTPDFPAGSDWVVTSPGVPKTSPPLAFARRRRIPIIGEIELAYRFCRGRIVAVTGSNGKTTTCHLIERLLAAQGHDAVLCGNVGRSFLDSLGKIGPDTTVVLELSSFQLEDCLSLRPRAAAVLNVSPNHLDRHKTLARYAQAKRRIYRCQKKRDLLALSNEDPIVRRMAKTAPGRVCFFGDGPVEEGVFFRDGWLVRAHARRQTPLFEWKRCPLEGRHNRLNAMAALAVLSDFHLDSSAVDRALSSFHTLEHRIELLGEVKGVRFVNDSKSTTLDSTRAALEAQTTPVVLVAGGRDKGVPFEAMAPELKAKARLVVLYGESREKMAAAWKGWAPLKLEGDFTRAVRLAFEAARPGDTVLLSPMCTSFDQFSSYDERGKAFKRIFRELASA